MFVQLLLYYSPMKRKREEMREEKKKKTKELVEAMKAKQQAAGMFKNVICQIYYKVDAFTRGVFYKKNAKYRLRTSGILQKPDI